MILREPPTPQQLRQRAMWLMACWGIWPALAPIAIFVAPAIASPEVVVPLILASVLTGAHGFRLWYRANEPQPLPVARVHTPRRISGSAAAGIQ